MADLPARDRREAQQWLLKMLDRPDLHQAGLDAWLANRPDREAYYQFLFTGIGRATSGAIRSGLEPRRQRRWPLQSFSKPAFKPFAAATLASLLLAASFVCLMIVRTAPPNHAVRLTTRVGEVRPERLSDGTLITLDTDTVMDVTIGSKDRVATLRQGRARFTVGTSAAVPPFIVTDGSNSIFASSAVFDVVKRGALEALVVTGEAQIRHAAAGGFDSDDRPIPIRSGQKLVLTSGQAAYPSPIDARPSDAQWIGGVKSFNEVPIDEVIAEANTYSQTQIVLVDPTLGSKLISAEMQIRDVNAVAQGIADYLDLAVDRSQPRRIRLVPRDWKIQ